MARRGAYRRVCGGGQRVEVEMSTSRRRQDVPTIPRQVDRQQMAFLGIQRTKASVF
jgi:ribosomal protein L44E